MSVVKSYVHGLAAASRRPKLVAILWLMNLALAVPAFFILRSALGGTLGSSLEADSLLGKAWLNPIFEFLTSSGVVVGQIVTAVLVLVALQVLAYIFAFGGILGTLRPEPRSQGFGQVFFGGGGRFYGRFFRLVVYSLVLWVPALVLFQAASSVIRLAAKDSVNERLTMSMGLLRVLLFLFLVFLVEMILDYARIKIALTDTRQVFRSLVGAARFVFSRPLKTVVLYYLLGLTGWAAFGIYLALRAAVPGTTTAAVIVGFLIAQAFLASRAWLRVAFLAAQKDFLESAVPGLETAASLPT